MSCVATRSILTMLMVVAFSGCSNRLPGIRTNPRGDTGGIERRDDVAVHLPNLPNPAVFMPTPPVWYLPSSATAPQPRLTSANGFIVCMPLVSMGLTRDDEALANACALWLKFQVEGSQAAHGTQGWNTIFRAGAEQGQPDGAIPLNGLMRLGRSTGVSHAIVTRLTGNAGRLVFSAQVYNLKSGKPCCKAVAVGTTQVAIVHHLPILADWLGSELNVKLPAPTALNVACTLSQFKRLGLLPFRFDVRAYRALIPDLLPAASHDPLTALLLIADVSSARHLPELRVVANVLRKLDPKNQFVVELLSKLTWGLALREVPVARAMLVHHPDDFLMDVVLARDFAHFCKGSLHVDSDLVRRVACSVVSASPMSPSAYSLGALVCMRGAKDLRTQSKTNATRGHSMDAIRHLMDEAYRLSQTAVHLDSDYVAGWRLYIAAAASDGHFKEASAGVNEAEQLAPYDPRVYQRAIELYGVHYRANTNDLVAATTHYAALVSSPYLQYAAVMSLRQCALQGDANALLHTLCEANRNWRKTSALHLSATLKLAVLEMLSFRTTRAHRHFQSVVRIDAGNSDALAGLGTLAYRDRNPLETARYLDAAIERDPAQYRVYAMDAWAALKQNSFSRARYLLTAALENRPDDELALSIANKTPSVASTYSDNLAAFLGTVKANFGMRSNINCNL